MNTSYILVAAGVLAGALGLALPAASPGPHAASAAKAAPLVSVATVVLRDRPRVFSAAGHVTPLNQVEVRPQVSAVVRAVHFSEGAQIARGQLLFSLDDRDVRAQLARVSAQAAQVQAQLDDAQRAVERSRSMVAAGFIAQSAADSDASKVASLQAQLAVARADIENARIQLGRTEIRAPVAGRSGALAVHPGSLVQPGDATPLVTLVQLDPIGVAFELPEQQLAAVRAAGIAATVRIAAAGAPREGKLSFIDSSVNSGSGTIALKASFANADGALWPGAYSQVEVETGPEPQLALLPPAAVLDGAQGPFVMVVGAGSRISAHPVTLLRVEHQAALVRGLPNGTRVVVEGAQEVRPGETVRVVGGTTP